MSCSCANINTENQFFISERGICLPTVSLWLLFVYIEASVRLRELKSLPFNLDLCRPFAAHWYVELYKFCFLSLILNDTEKRKNSLAYFHPYFLQHYVILH